ncbi:MAG: TonB-dependent receptor plug domain-containing protein [Polyangiaceae bacterium]
MRLALLTAPALVAVSLAVPRPARADDSGDLQGMLNETFVSGASKSTESGSAAPAVTTTLTADDIRRYGIHSIAEAIDFLSLGAATSSSIGTQDVGANGVLFPSDQGDHILLLVDGHAVNEALFGAARFDRGAGIPMEMVDHIEVILGPGSVLYGSSAMLGVVNVVTKDARAFAGTHLVAESELLTSWRASASGGYELTLAGQPAKLTLGVEYFTQDGPSFTVGPQVYGTNAYTNKAFNFTGPLGAGVWGGALDHSNFTRVPSGLLSFRVGELSLEVHASQFNRGMPFNAGFIFPDSNFDDANDQASDREIWGDLKHRLVLSAVAELRSRLYGDSFDYNRQAETSELGPQCLFNDTTCRKRQFGASRWIGLEEQVSFDWLKDATLVTLVGVDGRARWTLAQEDSLDAQNGAPLAPTTGALRSDDQVFGAYAQQTWQPVTSVGLNAGARYDRDQRFGDRVSPRIAASVETWSGGTLKAIYSEAFRAPSWEESSVVGENQIAADHLRPETVREIEVAFDQRLGSHRLLVGVFRSWWSDMVQLETLTPAELHAAQNAGQLKFTTSTAVQYQNVSSIDDLGFNAGWEGAFAQNHLRYAVNVTGTYARQSDGGGSQSPLAVAPPIFGNARIAYSLGGNLPTLAVAGRYLATRPANQLAFTPPPYAPPLGELRGTVSGPFPWLHGLSYRVSADWSATDRGPYVVGPFQTSASGGSTPAGVTKPPAVAELNPIDTFRATVGLQFDF